MSASPTGPNGFCTSCGKALQVGDHFCGKCGEPIAGVPDPAPVVPDSRPPLAGEPPLNAEKRLDDKFCRECGAVIRARAEICPRCGVRQFAGSPSLSTWSGGFSTAPNGRSKLAAALFGIFLGGLGVHKFYLGQTGPGIVYLIFCWTFIPAIIGFIEGVIYLTMTDQAFAEKYGMV